MAEPMERARKSSETYRNNTVQSPRGATLDADFLLQLRFVDEPSQLCSINISERKLNSVDPESLKLFTNVTQVDASINALTLGSFSCFVSLRELDLSLNGIRDVSFHAADFPHLEVLDLSYNDLSAEGLVSLGQLPRLKTLHLTGNELRSLPLTFASSEPDHAELPIEKGVEQFEALEVLLLDNNKLSSNVFYSLANLKRLQNLNLQGNRISAVPLVKVWDSLNPVQPSAEDGAHTPLNIDEYLNIMETFQTDSWDKERKGFHLPLPELQYLNLAENKISTEEALIGAAQFLKLSEIEIHSNPLITKKRGLPYLTFYLQERRGIEIKRYKEQKAKKPPLQLFIDPKWKVEGNLRKVPKRPFFTDPVCPTQMQCEETIQEIIQSEDKNNNVSIHKTTEHFFITQAEDEPEFELLSSSQKKQRNQSGPEESTSCKTIQRIKANPDVLKSIAIQTAVRMLEYRLKNLNVYRDSKPKLDSIQTPYTEREKRIKDLPPVGPKKQASQRVDEMMKEMKASSSITVVTIDASKAVNREDYKEFRSLLNDLIIRHKMALEKAWEHVADPS